VRTRRSHPFPEWATGSVDDPSFIRKMATFVRLYRRVGRLAYFDSDPRSVYDLDRAHGRIRSRPDPDQSQRRNGR
jgi:hypothetical protein